MSKFKKTYLLKKEAWEKVINKIITDAGLPQISFSLGIYIDDNDNHFELKFINSDCYFKVYNKKSCLDNKITSIFDKTSSIEIKNKNIKFF